MPKWIQAYSPEIAQLRMVMLEKSLTPAKLGKLVNFNPRRISNVLCGTDSTWPIRAAINQALGEKIFTQRVPRPPRNKTPKTPMFEALKKITRTLGEALREQAVMDSREKESKEALAQATSENPIDSPECQRAISKARMMLDAIDGRRLNVEKIILQTAPLVVEEFRRADRIWSDAVLAKRDAITAKIHAVNLEFFNGQKRVMISELSQITFPIFNDTIRAQTPDVPIVNIRTAPKDMPELVEQFLRHCRSHAANLSLVLKENT